MKYPYFLILFILSCTPPLPQEDNNQLSECNAPYGYDCGDISVLQKFIELNSSPEILVFIFDKNLIKRDLSILQIEKGKAILIK